MKNLRVALLITWFMLLGTACSMTDGLPNTPRPTVQPTKTAFIATSVPSLIRPTASFPGVVTGLMWENNRWIATHDRVCVYVEQKPLWKPGDFWSDFDTTPSVNIHINDAATRDPRRTLTGVLYVEEDTYGEVIGTHGYGMETCIQLDEQQSITYSTNNLMKVTVEYNGATLFADSWGFAIDNQLVPQASTVVG